MSMECRQCGMNVAEICVKCLKARVHTENKELRKRLDITQEQLDNLTRALAEETVKLHQAETERDTWERTAWQIRDLVAKADVSVNVRSIYERVATPTDDAGE